LPLLVDVVVRAVPQLYGVSDCRVAVGEVKALARAGPLDGLAVNLELLVGVVGAASPDLKLDAIDVVTVGHIETLVVIRPDGAGERREGCKPGEVGVGRVRAAVADAAAHERYGRAIAVRGGTDAEGLAFDRIRLVGSVAAQNDLRGSEIGIGSSTPLLVVVVSVTGPELQLSAVRKLPISQVDALVGSTPLESAVEVVDPLLVRSSTARPDLQFRADSINTASHIKAFVARDCDWAGAGAASDGKGGGPLLQRGVLGIAIVDLDRSTISILSGGNAALDSRVEE